MSLQLDMTRIPTHIALVMDGNGRWAQQRGLPRTEGHKAGELALAKVTDACIDLGIKYLSAFWFSTENWKRPIEEVRFLMNFNTEVLQRRRDEFDAKNVQIRWSGRKKRVWKSVAKELEYAQENTKNNTGLVFNICLNYGGQAEIADAMSAIATQVAAGQLNPNRISEKTIAKNLYHPDIPPVDLFLRSSGEQRTSNFLLWQSAYAELVFLEDFFPDFTGDHLIEACRIYQSRNRRYGAVPTATQG